MRNSGVFRFEASAARRRPSAVRFGSVKSLTACELPCGAQPNSRTRGDGDKTAYGFYLAVAEMLQLRDVQVGGRLRERVNRPSGDRWDAKPITQHNIHYRA